MLHRRAVAGVACKVSASPEPGDVLKTASIVHHKWKIVFLHILLVDKEHIHFYTGQVKPVPASSTAALPVAEEAQFQPSLSSLQ
jgi:hypothetical protein